MLARYLPEPATQSIELDLPAGTVAGDIGNHLGLAPGLITMVAVNGRRVESDQPLRNGDRITLFPPVAGG